MERFNEFWLIQTVSGSSAALRQIRTPFRGLISQ